MPTIRMHADEVATSSVLVAQLLRRQFPHWAELPIAPVALAGTDHALYRLGDELVARLPRIHWAVGQAEKERRWLPWLAPQLPLEIPTPLALGVPQDGYPWPWSVYRWVAGENATPDCVSDLAQTARDLAGFVAALQRIDATGGPPPGPSNSGRGAPLASRDAAMRAAIAASQGLVDTVAVTAAWEAALCAPVYADPPVWLHGDLQVGNLLARAGRLAAVIDFGCLGVGDPACDLMTAWLYLPAETRGIFRETLPAPEAAWERARGWALSVGVIALPYYVDTNPTLAAIARRAIEQVLADPAG